MNAELIALCEALSYIRSIDFDQFVIFTDSRSALQHLARCASAFRGTPTAYSVLRLILELQSQHKSIKLQWIPSHCNIDGNDRVDSLAKQACTEGDLVTILPFYSDNIHIIKDHCYSWWKEYFDQRSREKGIWYKTIVTHPFRTLWFDKSNLNRTDIVTALRLRSGHTPCRYFAFLMQKVDTPLCPDCGVVEDTYHLLVECVRGDAYRARIGLNLRMAGVCNGVLARPTSDQARILYKLVRAALSG